MSDTSISPYVQAKCLIEAGLQSKILFPSDDGFAARIDSYWSNDAKLKPACILQPRSAADVAKAIRALKSAQQPFAVRSGGHTNWAGSNNIADGVTIDLCYLNATQFDPETGTADLGPGATWGDVYHDLAQHGRVVAGGREPSVGVAGFLLGGGLSYYSGRCGLGCDTVLGYEVALADGSIVYADAGGEHADLFRVLKGGGNNFGIVTRFTLQTMPSGPIWGGLVTLPRAPMPAAAEAAASFVSNITSDPDSSMFYVLSHGPVFGGDASLMVCVNVAAVEKPPAFDQVLRLPNARSNCKKMALADLMTVSPLASNFYNVWFTICFRNNSSIILKASELHNDLVSRIQSQFPDENFTVNSSFQPIPRLYSQRAVAAGGNMLGAERYDHDGILLHVSVAIRTPEMEEWVRPQVRALIDEVRKTAEGIHDGILPWKYLNYSDPSQPVLPSYGRENVAKMRAAGTKYDPSGVFQRLCPGGFKIPFDDN